MRRTGLLLLFLLTFISFNLCVFPQSDSPVKKGYKDYVEFLKANKETLNYNTYGLIENTDEVVIKIYGDEGTEAQILETLISFNVTKHLVEEYSEGQRVISVYFPLKEKPEEVQAPAAAQEMTGDKKIEAKGKKCPGRMKVQARSIEPRMFSELQYYKLPLVYDQDLALRTEVTARVKEVLAAAGDRVQQGQVLARLDSTVLEKEIKSIEALLKKWKEILRQRQHWKERNPRAEKMAEDQVRDSEALLAEKIDALSKTQVKAPFDGKIIAIVGPGEPLEAGTIMLRMVSDGLMKIPIPAQDSGFFHSGQIIPVFLETLSGELTGTVVRTDPEIKIVLDNRDLKLSEGMMAGFRILVREHPEAIVVYEKEVLRDETGDCVFVVDGKWCSKRKVEIGTFQEGEALVLSGLYKGDEVIYTGIDCLKDKKKIKVMVWDESQKKLRARKKKEVIGVKKIEPPIEEPVVPVKREEKAARKSYWRLGGGLFASLITDDIYTDVYGSITPAGFLTVSYVLKDRIEFFVSGVYATKNGASTGLEEETTLNMIPVYLGGRFYFNEIKKFTPYLGAAVNRYSAREKFPETDEYREDTDWYSSFGYSVFGGTYFSIGSRLDLVLNLGYDFNRITIDEEDEDKINFSGLRLQVGIIFAFGHR